MDPKVREAVCAAMLRIKSYRKLSSYEFEKALEWAMREVKLSPDGRIIWMKFDVGRELLRVLWKLQKRACFHCEVEMDVMRLNRNRRAFWPTFEHVLPISRGGRDHPNNLVAACHSCNSRRGNTSLEFFI